MLLRSEVALHAAIRGVLPCLVLAAGLAGQVRYAVVDLGVRGTPEGINQLGEIVGRRSVGTQARIFVHDPASNTVTDPGLPAGTNAAFARDLNEAGQVVGNAWDQPIEQPGRAFLFTPGVGMRDLGELVRGGRSAAFAVDNLGNAGGAADGTAFGMEAFFWAAGGPMASVQPGNEGSVTALADSGWQGGSLGWTRRPFFVDPAGQRGFVPLPSGFDSGGVAAVSENGWMAGVMLDPSGSIREAFRYHAPTGRFDTLGLVSRNGAIHGVDSVGTVVGFRQISTRVDPVAMISFGGNPLVDLDTLLAPGNGWTLLRAKGINEAGQICALARPTSGPDTVVRLDPSRPAGSAGAARSVGSGCSGIELRAGPPHVGRTWSLALRGAPIGHATALVVGVGHPAPVSLPGQSCAVYVPIAGGAFGAGRGTSNALGAWAQGFAVPQDPALIGGRFSAQAVVVDATAPLGIRLSSGLQLVFGG